MRCSDKTVTCNLPTAGHWTATNALRKYPFVIPYGYTHNPIGVETCV